MTFEGPHSKQRASRKETKSSIVSHQTLESFSDINPRDLINNKQNAIDVFGVRIVPATVIFTNTFENQIYEETLSVQNVSNKSVTLRIFSPRAWAFQITPLERGHLLAPGLKITRNIHYTSSNSSFVYSTLPILVNDECYEIPLQGYKGQVFVEIVPSFIDFGRVDVSSKPMEKLLTIKNISSCATKFLIDVGRNELNLQVSPLKGWIRPHNYVVVHLQLIALEVGTKASEIWVTTDLSQSRVQVTMEACRRSLFVLHPNTTSDFTLIAFPRTFYGCRRFQTVVVFNMAATSSAFVVLADCGNRIFEPIMTAKKKNCTNSRMFHVEPAEGHIRPFEKRIFTVWFQPRAPQEPETGWKQFLTPKQQDFLCAVRIKRLQVEDFGRPQCEIVQLSAESKHVLKHSSAPDTNFLIDDEDASGESPSLGLIDDVSVLLCLYGEADEAMLSVVPDTLHFTDTSVGKKDVRVIHVVNKSQRMLAIRYNKIPYFEANPSFKEISPQTTLDVGITLCARSLGLSPKHIEFDVLAPTDNSTEIGFQVVNILRVLISLTVKSETIVPKPQFNLGITPKITHEVGFLTQDVTFNSEVCKPKCAMVSNLNDKSRPWLRCNARIAFPNDMPKSLRAIRTDYPTKTIFKGTDRYIPPIDESMTYTVEQFLQKKAADLKYLEYIRGTAAVAIPVTDHECCKLKISKPNPSPHIVFEKKQTSDPRDVLVPLTFVQLYHIKVSPTLITFGSVTTSKKCSQFLSIHNNNNFKIVAKLISLSFAIHVQTKDHFIVNANSETRVMLTFLSEVLGRYSGTVTCVINGFHSLDIAVLAEVVQKSLSVFPSERVEYRLPEAPFALTFVPIEVQNPLNASVNFSWLIPEGSPFTVEPTQGVSPKKGKVLCAAYFEPSNPNYKLHPLKLMVEGVISHKLKTGVVLSKPKVYFLESILNVGNLPLNLMTVKRFVVFNPDFSDSMFVILNQEPVKGVTVEPASGQVKARSCLTLSLNLKVTTQGTLDFVVFMNCQNSVTIEMKVIGEVVSPEIDINPKYISLTRTFCNSVVKTPITAVNKSKARVVVGFNMEEYPQFKVSLSRCFHDNAITDEGFNLEPGAIQKFYLHFIPKDLASYDFNLPVILNGQAVNRRSSVKEIEQFKKRITTLFRQATLRSESTETKSIANSISEKVGVGDIIVIDVSVLKPLINISDTYLQFETFEEKKSFVITNVSEEPIALCIRFEETQTAFTTEVIKGDVVKEKSSLKSTLMPEDSIIMRITFKSKIPGSFMLDMHVTLSYPDHEQNYTSIRLVGVINPSLTITASVSSIYFPQVPLNTDFGHTFQLTVNNSYDEEVEVGFEINLADEEFFIVNFPEGKTVPAQTKLLIPVKVIFSSQLPCTIRRVLTFRVGSSQECSINMIATADNCLLSTHAYLKSHCFISNDFKENDQTDKESDSVNFKDNHVQLKQPLFGDFLSSKQENEASSSGSASNSMLSLGTSESSTILKVRKSSLSSRTLKKTVQFSPRSIKPVATALSAFNGYHPKRTTESRLSLKRSQIENVGKPLLLQTTTKEELSISDKDSISVEEIKLKETNDIVFPMFPSESCVTEYAIHMNRARQAVQDWIFEQIFNCSYNLILGSDAFSTFTQTNKDYGRSPPVAMRNIFDVLERICGRAVKRYFTSLNKLPEEPSAKAVFSHLVYKQFLDFMMAQGALLAHVDPMFLMGYDDYVVYCKTNPSSHRSFVTYDESFETDNHDLLNQESFKSISIQSWLDVFLQIYKTLVLAPAVGLKVGGNESELSKRLTCPCHEVDLKKSVYSKAEEVLLTWLTHKYNVQRSTIWQNQTPGPRNISNFDTHLEDCLVLIVVTATFCPFLKATHFQNIFLQPKTVSHVYHNAISLVTAWERIKLGISVSPKDFVCPNSVKMLMVVSHLYKVLPSYKPETIVKFSAVLNSSDSQVITLKNVEEWTVTYSIEIIPTTLLFTLQGPNNIALKKGQKGEICVKYTARTTAKMSATLLVCGACMPPKFGRNYVFTLEGTPVELPITAAFNIISPLNIASNTQLKIESPHKEQCSQESIDYEIWITELEPKPGSLEANSWSRERKRKIPRRLFVHSEKLTVINKEKTLFGFLDVKVCCFSQAIHNYWFLFKNAEVGDFIVKLMVSPGPPEPSTILRAILEPDSQCTCGPEVNFLCSRTATVKIPCRNLHQWTAVRAMFELTISDSEKQFWASYLESNIAYRLLRWMMEEKKEKLNEEIELIFQESKSYKVSCESPLVVTSPKLDIPNVRSISSLPLEIHVAEDSPNHSTQLTLTSMDNQEIRCFTLNVFCDY